MSDRSSARGAARPLNISPSMVTFEEFAAFVRSGAYWEPSYWTAAPSRHLKGDAVLRRLGFEWPRRHEPVSRITWFEADAYCRHRGGRLPYSDELQQWFTRSIRPPTVTPEWCGDYYNPYAQGPGANPEPPLRRRVHGWPEFYGAVPGLIRDDFTFRVVFIL
jgi:hypothetical protein